MKKIDKLTMDMMSDYIIISYPIYLEKELIWYDKCILLIAFDKNHDYYLDNMDGDWGNIEIEGVDCENWIL